MPSRAMHFNWYMENRLLLKLYARYFWYFGADARHPCAGRLLRRCAGRGAAGRDKGRAALLPKLGHAAVCARVRCAAAPVCPRRAGVYEAANRALFEAYRRTHTPDGEVLFLAAAPAARGTGVGSLLLAELARRAPGKEVYLYTDDACTYQFYEKRGFTARASDASP